MKPINWRGDTRERARELPDVPRRTLGFELDLVQRGKEPRDWKPMSSIGPGVHELRIRSGGEYRAIYIARFEEAIYVLHVFEKKSRKTSRNDLTVARLRFRALVAERDTL